MYPFSPVVVDRERVIRPFKVAGLLGAYNVFAIARGGGTTGQSGAVSLAIAKGLAAHVPDVEAMLRKGALIYLISLVPLLTCMRSEIDET